jgi:Flp pilus assembly protein TadD
MPSRGLRAAVLLGTVTVTTTVTAVASPVIDDERLTLKPVDREPKDGQKRYSSDELAAFRRDVVEHPDDRGKRLLLVRALVSSGDLDGALTEAKAWRAKDAYNLVAVRALGDVLTERGDREEAERVYSAIVELLPRDTDAQRALATLLKQRGDLEGARGRLVAAVESRPEDPRLAFELADVELRLGDREHAAERFAQVIGRAETNEQIRYPAKLRLAQALGETRRDAKAKGDSSEEKRIGGQIDALGIKGGTENDIHVYLTWDTDRTDVDLWVTTPTGEKVAYDHRQGAGGEALFDDVTTGYGPESFTAKRARTGDYKIQVNYFSGHRGAFPEARGEVVVVLDEGKPTERKQTLPYRLFAEKQTVTVATVHVRGGK